MEEEKFIHVIAFNVPFPPDYGGIIDIYYKLRAMKDAGLNIILHSFIYDRKEARELDNICHTVYYYKRRSGFRYFFHPLPYIVITRNSEELERNLLGDRHPVMFEGIHTTYLLDKCVAAGKRVLVRTHNIEHKYYGMLSQSERGLFRKLFLRSESAKLARYESILGRAGQLLSISTTDTAYFNEKYGNSRYVSAFHQHHEVTSPTGTGDYILFHGNLSVPENEKALLYLVKNVLSKVGYRVVIAGKDPSHFVRKRCNRYPHIELISNPSGDAMNKLVSNAHINLLYTYQPTGLKLKLLHSLYGGRHCMANPLMLSGSGLDPLCQVYSSPGEAIAMIQTLMTVPFDKAGVKERMEKLRDYSNSSNAEKIIALI
ncbi:MAG: glycosyltransferase family 1 protein [Bacteroidales bacterium]